MAGTDGSDTVNSQTYPDNSVGNPAVTEQPIEEVEIPISSNYANKKELNVEITEMNLQKKLKQDQEKSNPKRIHNKYSADNSQTRIDNSVGNPAVTEQPIEDVEIPISSNYANKKELNVEITEMNLQKKYKLSV